MTTAELIETINNGEDSFTQFKRELIPPKELAKEFVAFSNTQGGVVIFGVADDREIKGIDTDEIESLGQLVGNVANDIVKPPVHPLIQSMMIEDKRVVVVSVSKGINKPYATSSGEYYIKSGADKKKISQDELRRLFAESHRLFADESIVNGADITDLNIEKFYKFLKDYDEGLYLKLKNHKLDLQIILNNFNLMKEDKLTLAGNLIFGIHPQQFNKSFYVDCCYFNGNDISVSSYISEGRKTGSFETLYDESTSFIKSNLQNRQVEADFNSSGVLEIDERVLGELVINALIHRDYYINTSIKIFMFYNRVEIISPGKLTNSLTVEKIKQGIAIKRNPILDSICNKIFPYTGRGSGIRRVLSINPNVEFVNDTDKDEFKCIIPRHKKQTQRIF